MPVPTGVVCVLLVMAVGTKVNMASQGFCPAGNDLIHHLYLIMGCAVSIQKLFSGLSENIGDVVFRSAVKAVVGFHWSISEGLITLDMILLLICRYLAVVPEGV